MNRLQSLLDRFEAICERAEEHRSKGQMAMRLGLGDDAGLMRILDEIISKAGEQAGLCGQSISLLLVDRSFPLFFKRGVTRAESFADQCEGILNQLDASRDAGKEAFRNRFGVTATRA